MGSDDNILHVQTFGRGVGMDFNSLFNLLGEGDRDQIYLFVKYLCDTVGLTVEEAYAVAKPQMIRWLTEGLGYGKRHRDYIAAHQEEQS